MFAQSEPNVLQWCTLTTGAFMATEKNRFSISLDDQTYNVYKRFAQLSGKPLATIISSMLVDAREHFVQLGVVLQRAEALKGETAEQKSAFLSRIDMGMHRAQAAVDLLGSDLVEMAKKPVAATGAAKPRGAAKVAAQSLIHTNKVPKPRPATVSAVLSKKSKGSKRAST